MGLFRRNKIRVVAIHCVIVTRVMLKKEKVVERKRVIVIKYIYFSDDKSRLWKKLLFGNMGANLFRSWSRLTKKENNILLYIFITLLELYNYITRLQRVI